MKRFSHSLTTGPVGTFSIWHLNSFSFLLLLVAYFESELSECRSLCFCFQCVQISCLHRTFSFHSFFFIFLALVERFYLEFYGVEPTQLFWLKLIIWTEHMCTHSSFFICFFFFAFQMKNDSGILKLNIVWISSFAEFDTIFCNLFVP